MSALTLQTLVNYLLSIVLSLNKEYCKELVLVKQIKKCLMKCTFCNSEQNTLNRQLLYCTACVLLGTMYNKNYISLAFCFFLN